jgi:hypothetical protein
MLMQDTRQWNSHGQRFTFQIEKRKALQSEVCGLGWRREGQGISGYFATARTLHGQDGMLDLLSIAATVIFFLIALAYVQGCEKL